MIIMKANYKHFPEVETNILLHNVVEWLSGSLCVGRTPYLYSKLPLVCKKCVGQRQELKNVCSSVNVFVC